MAIQERISNYISEKGIKLVWIAQRVAEIDPCANFTAKKLSASLLGDRRLTLDEFFLICNVLKVSPDMFNSEKDRH